MAKKTNVPVGTTPKSKYATWDEHREALRREAKVNRQKQRVQVGATPEPKYATWDEHREALRREAKANRQKRRGRPK